MNGLWSGLVAGILEKTFWESTQTEQRHWGNETIGEGSDHSMLA